MAACISSGSRPAWSWFSFFLRSARALAAASSVNTLFSDTLGFVFGFGVGFSAAGSGAGLPDVSLRTCSTGITETAPLSHLMLARRPNSAWSVISLTVPTKSSPILVMRSPCCTPETETPSFEGVAVPASGAGSRFGCSVTGGGGAVGFCFGAHRCRRRDISAALRARCGSFGFCFGSMALDLLPYQRLEGVVINVRVALDQAFQHVVERIAAHFVAAYR